MSDVALVPNQQFVAVSPRDLPVAQRQVIDWCRAKIAALGAELREQRENAREAQKMLWRNRWPAAIHRTKRAMVYYAKIKKALEAGYLIVPNFDVDVIAVRVERGTPKMETSTQREPAKPEMLPPGVGRYVDDALVCRDDSYQDKWQDGTPRIVPQYTATGYSADIDFPAALVKPAVLAATDRAMALRLFDRIGIVRKSRRSDPIRVIALAFHSRWH